MSMEQKMQEQIEGALHAQQDAFEQFEAALKKQHDKLVVDNPDSYVILDFEAGEHGAMNVVLKLAPKPKPHTTQTDQPDSMEKSDEDEK